MFMAGDNNYAKDICSGLATDLGFEQCYDFGGGDTVALLEQFALCWVNLAIIQGQGRGLGFKLVKR